MKNSDKVLIGVGLGLLAGGVVGYFLASEEGQKMQRNAKAKLREINADVQQTLKEKSEVIGEKLSSATDSAKTWVDEASATVKNKISRTSDAAEDVVDNMEDSFQDGIAKARRNIDGHSGSIENILDNA